MEGLQVLLFDCLCRDKAHMRSADRLADRRGIIGVVLLRLQIRFDELRGNQPHSMSKHFENTGPMMSSLRRLQTDHAAWKIRKEIRHLPSTQPLLESKPAFLIGSVELKHILRGIKTYNARCWHGSRTSNPRQSSGARATSQHHLAGVFASAPHAGRAVVQQFAGAVSLSRL